MSSWNQPQSQPNQTLVGNAQFNPYFNMYPQQAAANVYNKLPVYKADPIQGENAAWQFPMGPNSEIYLPDNEEDIIWWIRTDGAGNRTVTPFDVKLHKKPEPVDMNKILERLEALEEKVNAKSNKSNAKRNNNPVTVVEPVVAAD